MKLILPLLAAASLPLAACSKADEPASPAATATASAASPAAATASAAPSAAAPEPGLDGGDGEDAEEQAAGGAAPDSEREPEQEEAADSDVAIENVGMRIAGGSNDGAAKEPIRKAIMAAFPSFRSCHAKVTGKRRSGTYGVDIRIARDGGRATIREPRSELKGDEFKRCMKEAIEAIDFPKPASHKATVVSYSVRFRAKGPAPSRQPPAAETEPEEE